MNKTLLVMLVLLMMLTGNTLLAADNPAEFNNPILKERYYSLLEEIRCLVCQNQTLAASHADLAQDLRNEIYKMVNAGKQDDQIIQFLVERYGDFVLYRPPLKENTWLLWLGPFLFLVIASCIAIYLIRRQSNGNIVDTNISEDQKTTIS